MDIKQKQRQLDDDFRHEQQQLNHLLDEFQEQRFMMERYVGEQEYRLLQGELAHSVPNGMTGLTRMSQQASETFNVTVDQYVAQVDKRKESLLQAYRYATDELAEQIREEQGKANE